MYQLSKFAVFSIAVLIGGQSFATETSLAEYGMGIESSTEEVLGKCVSFVAPEDENESGQSYSFSLDYLESQSDLKKSLNVSASGELKGLWGKASAKSSFYSQQSINRYSLNFTIRAEVRAQFRSLSNPKLIEGIQTSNPLEFKERCGDKYIHSIQKGGSLYAIVSVNTRNEYEKKKLKTSISASFNSGVKASANLGKQLEKSLSSKQYSVSFYQEGGAIIHGTPSVVSLGEFFEYAQKVRDDVLKNPIVIDYRTKSYKTLDRSLTARGTKSQRRLLRSAADLVSESVSRNNDIAFILSNTRRFITPDTKVLSEGRRTLDNQLRKLKYLSEDCSSDPTDCDIEELETIQNKIDGVIAQLLPLEFPIYRVFENVQQEQPWKSRSLTKANCVTWWQDRIVVGDLDVSDSTNIRYGYMCEKRHGRYDCGGGVDMQFYKNIDRFSGYVSAKVEMSAGKLAISNVSNQPASGAPSKCADYLVNFIKSKNGSSLR